MAGLTFVNQVGAVEGMNQAAPGTLIPDTFVRWAQDVLFDRAGLIRRRGPFANFNLYKTNATTGLAEVADFTDPSASDEVILGVLATYDPSGAERIGMLVYKTIGSEFYTVLRVFDKSFVFLGEETLPFKAAMLSIISAKPALGGGLWVSIADDPADPTTHYQFLWRGGAGTSMTTRSATISAATLQNSGIIGSTDTTNDWANGHKYYSKTLSGSTSNLTKGMFVYVKTGSSYYYIGTIANTNNNEIILEKHPFIWNSAYDNNSTIATSTVDLVFTSVRPYEHFHGRGLLNTTYNSTTATSGDLGTSAEGHWRSAAVGNYFLYRASDNVYLGKIDSVTDNKQLQLHANPGTNIKADEYIMRLVKETKLVSPSDFVVNSRSANSFAGLYTAVYAGYQWYGNFAKDDQNTNRVVFSASHDREAVDLSADSADSIIFPGKSKFRGMGASSAGLLVFLEDRTYILRGNDRTNFSVEQLVPEGCLCPASIVEYGGGVFWAGKSGIMFYDGASVRNLTKDNLGLYYTDSLDVFNPTQDRVIGFIHKNNLIMHYTAWKSPFDPIRYEPIYVSDWTTNPAYADRSWDELDPAFTADDLNTEANVPIYWDQKKLNNPEESASTGTSIVWNKGGRVTNKALTSNVATLTLSNGHGFIVGDSVIVSGVGSPFNGTFTITAKTNTSISYACVNANISSTAVSPSGLALGSVTTGTTSVWGNTSSINKYGPLRKNTSMTFSVYLPTNALTTLSNMDFRGVASIETMYGLKTIVGVNSVETAGLRARLIDIHPVFDTATNGPDDLLIEKINMPSADLVMGPDFYIQTKHFTVGDPVLRKWFQRVLISMLLYDGAVRMDLVDDDDNDAVDIAKKKHQYWELFTEEGYDWDYLGRGAPLESDPTGTIQFGVVFPKLTSPAKSTWNNVQNTQTFWQELFTSDFNRYVKRLSWRKSSAGFRLYQLNNYKKPFNGVVTKPNRVELQGFSLGFKALRQGRV